jgi:RHS repeat-associated protein
MRFAGEYLDTATTLYHLRARQYDPAVGRFLALDPVAPSLGMSYVSGYLYANSRPTALVDPSGMSAEAGDAFPLIDAEMCDPLPTMSYYDPITKRLVPSVSSGPCVLLMPTQTQSPVNGTAPTCVIQTEFDIVTCPSADSANERFGKNVDPRWEYAPGVDGFDGPVGPCRYSHTACRAIAAAILITVVATLGCYATGCDPEAREPQQTPWGP